MTTLRRNSITVEIVVRIILAVTFYITDDAVPYYRKIQPEEYWLYSYPTGKEYYSANLMWLTVFGLPTVVIGIFLLLYKDRVDAKQAALGVVLSIYLTGSVTNFIKLGVGRPRPDFLQRCFPDGKIDDDMKCTGSEDSVVQGYKSFPSGHSSISFSSLCFLSLYIAGKLHCFNRKGRGEAWRICCFIFPLMWATMIAISRTADFHHHWQDVTVGGALGIVISYLCYRQYYPPVNKTNGHLPYISLPSEVDTIPQSPLLPLTNPNLVNTDSALKIV